ncbi:hypothetical protein [Flavobacterium sp.]|uniref:hypothetical protein n=1 Tax=Flavobacterium sp. TaxID=239 RepID=UPI00262FA01C|nr:hypothetical protein [Flavobacterium sp.]
MKNLKEIKFTQDKKISRFHFFACKYGFISNELIYLFFLDAKQVDVKKIIDVNVYEKYQTIIKTIQYKILIFLLVLLNLIFFNKSGNILFLSLLILSLIIGLLIKIKIVVFNINNGKKLEFKICKKEIRKAKLFKKKILEYKKHLELNEFYN